MKLIATVAVVNLMKDAFEKNGAFKSLLNTAAPETITACDLQTAERNSGRRDEVHEAYHKQLVFYCIVTD